jgi:hypothetical protein
VSEGDRRALFGTRRAVCHYLFRCRPGVEWTFHVEPVDRRQSRARIALVVETLERRCGRWVPAGTRWHPFWVDLRP